MKIVQIERLIDAGGFSNTEQWKVIENHLMQAIKSIQWPPGSGSFTLFDQPGKARGQGSGVKPIKDAGMLEAAPLASEDVGSWWQKGGARK